MSVVCLKSAVNNVTNCQIKELILPKYLFNKQRAFCKDFKRIAIFRFLSTSKFTFPNTFIVTKPNV